MKVAGTATLHAPVEEVWRALNDPSVLVRTIPGCQQLEETGADAYRMTITAGVASIKGTYAGTVRLSDQDPPGSFVLRAQGAGAPGTVDATVHVTLAAESDGETRLDYDADAVVGGPVGGVGQRVLVGVAKKTAGEFFAAVDGVLTGAEAEQPPASGGEPGAAASGAAESGVGEAAAPVGAGVGVPISPAAGGRVFQAPPAPGRDDRVPFWVVLAGVGTGAVWALAGVLVGYRIARSRTP
jgi:carbon monoxide dehydrogenase subunit G